MGPRLQVYRGQEWPRLRPLRERGYSWAPGVWQGTEEAGGSEWPSVSLQETSIPEELLVTVVKPGLPTLADLHVLLPPPRPTRKRSLTSDKVSPVATGPGPPHAAEGLVVIPGKHGDLSLSSSRIGLSLTNHCPSSPLWLP